jgi:cytochrome P450/CRP-like cAMP-binding protein
MNTALQPLRDEVLPRPPVAPGLPLLGAGLAAYRDPFRLFADAHLAAGPVFRVVYPGRELTMIAGLAANELLARQGHLFDMARTYRRVTAELGSDRYPNPHDGAEHRKLRRLLAPSLSAQAVDPFLPQLFERIDQARRSWPAGPVPLRQIVGPLVADMVSLVATNQPMGPSLARDAALYGSMLGIVGVGGAFPDFTLRLPPVQAARRRLESFLLEALAAHRAKGPGLRREPDLLDALLAGGGGLDPQALVALAVQPAKNAGIYLYRVVSFVLHAILRDPPLREAVQAEVDLAFAWGPPGLAELKKMALLERVVLECLRRYPLALALPRVVAQPFDFEGHRFQPGTTVYIAGPVTHFLPELFPEPDRFDPDRMGPGRVEHRRPHAFVPFGGGPHACLARGFTQALTAAVVGGLLHGLELSLPPGEQRLLVRGLPIPIPEARFRLLARPRSAPPPPREARARLDEGAPPLLIGLSAMQREAVFDDLRLRSLAPGEVLYQPGGAADTFFVVRSGLIVLEGSPDQRLGPGQHFGARGILQGLQREERARASSKGPVELLCLGREAYRMLAVECDLTRAELARVVERRQALTGLAAVLPKLRPERVERLGSKAERLTLPAGRVILHQGEEADRFYVLVEGVVEVLGRLADGSEFPLAELVGPDCFGEIGLLERRPRSATVRARTEVRLLVLDAEAFDALVADTSGTGVDLAKVASERLAGLGVG